MEILPQLLVNSLITGSIYALVSGGLALTFGLLRVLNFAHGHLMMTGAYLYLFSLALWEGNPILAGLTSAGLTLVLSGVAAVGFILPFLEYGTLIPFVTTLALATTLESIVSMTFGVNVKSLHSGVAGESWQIGSVYVTPLQIGIIFTSVVTLVLLAIIAHRTRVGRRLRALAENAEAASMLGVHRNRVYLFSFMASALLATLAGVLIGYETNLQPTMGNAYTIKAFAAMILGGLGSVWGALVGSYLLGLIENLSIGLDFNGWSLPAGYKDAFAYMIILVVLLLRPHGLFGTAGRRA